MRENKVEILAPAGSVESLKAAIAAGADAIYIGGSKFGARAYADNPDEDKLLEAMDYVHLHGKKMYMTVNTLMKEQEMGQLYDYLYPYYIHGLDAVIVQDMGVFSFVRKHFPDLPIHASTQMTITGVYGARLMKELGAERVVTARELSLREIDRIHQEVDIEIESFVHGALCYCYSGQCLFSSLIGGRSGNRGRCAQTCRLPFDVKQGGKTLNKKDERYVLSLKDLATLDLIPDMIEAGIYSMKIEGRMKSPRYTAGVVSVYSKYVDLYLSSGRKGYHVEEADRQILRDLFDRGGQTDGYYKKHNGRDMVVWKEKPAFREGNQELFDRLDQEYVGKQVREPIEGSVFLEEGKKSCLILNGCGQTVTVYGDVVQTALNQPMGQDKVKKQLEKTGNTPFVFDNLEITIGGNIFMPVQALNDLRRKGLEALEEAVLAVYKREKLNHKADFADNDNDDGDNKKRSDREDRRKTDDSLNTFKLYVSLERPDSLTAALEADGIKRIYIDAAEFSPDLWKNTVDSCHKAGKECMLTMPHIFRTEGETFFDRNMDKLTGAGFDGVLIRSMEEVGYLKSHAITLPMVFDYGMYGMNQQAEAMMKGLGADSLTWPVELNAKELGKLTIPGELLVYGRLPMMVTAQCLHQGMSGCDKKPGVLMLKDRLNKEFPVKNHCTFCYNTVYNTDPLSLAGLEEQVKRLGPSALRLQFTVEDGEQTREIIENFSQRFLYGRTDSLLEGEFTRGHFKRGIE